MDKSMVRDRCTENAGEWEQANIFPSIASADHSSLRDVIGQLSDYPLLHIDVEDGNFVPNITFGIKTIKALRGLTSAAFDAHLMVTDPAAYIPQLLALDFKAIAFHWESAPYPMALINSIHQGNAKAGIALNPRTSAAEILSYLPEIDYVLIMTSEPDGLGDQFQPATLDKIRQIRAADASFPIMVDGGISEELLPSVLEAGATQVVMGRAVFSTPDPYETLRVMNEKSR